MVNGLEFTFGDLFELSVPGGGKIVHGEGKLYVYGKSGAYGIPDHRITMQLLESHFSKYPLEGFTYSEG